MYDIQFVCRGWCTSDLVYRVLGSHLSWTVLNSRRTGIVLAGYVTGWSRGVVVGAATLQWPALTVSCSVLPSHLVLPLCCCVL